MGVGVIFELQGLDTRKMTNEFILTVYAGIAQAESENLSANVRWGWEKSFKNGNVHIQYKNFLGYREGADGEPEIDPDEAVIVRRIYDRFLAGLSMQVIADELSADGIPTIRGGTEWRPENIQSILRNEKYIGDAILQKTYISDCLTHKSKVNTGERPQWYVENNHPAIIERPTWQRVQEELARRSGKRKVKEKGTKTELGRYSGKYALTEILVCGNCGKPYRRCTWSRNGQKKIVWRCISRLDYGKKYCANSPSVEESVLQAAILDAWIEQARIIPEMLTVLKRQLGMALTNAKSGDDPYALQAQIAALDRDTDELYLAQRKDPQGDYESRFEALYGEKAALKKRLADIKANTNHIGAEQAQLDEIFAVTNGIRNSPMEWSEMGIRQAVERVKVLSKDRISVKFRYGDTVEIPLG